MTGQEHPPPTDPRERRRLARRHEIMDVALAIAEGEGWEAVTTRRVARSIDYSQPVIYQHFASRDDLVAAIARRGFDTLTGEIESVARTGGARPFEGLCRRYVEFGRRRPRLYEVMFGAPTSLVFATADTPEELRRTFLTLRELVARGHQSEDADGVTEFFWACCHGLVSLLLAGRIPETRVEEHVRRIGHLLDG
ncbi:TetR/AcrR family transcriptional regulator [Actinoalloteichus sp. AHMU CJ021]|uniref:TetR/AcrR family transcriptional regulator n=1 Tax=Actinoalloteichus TaxID=65496 RepID=UPI0004ABBCF0|nr:TetR/AcrR family transcriptional regulator [Actinoalloteichus caeruleus]AUS78460.1 TetR/AcrR family transcriptional regulator [Actinoalloteichus sp. AHMU CJ021]